MKRSLGLLLVLTLLLVTAHRLPAPIQEVPESPTPVPEQSAKPKPKRTIKPKVSSEDSEARQSDPRLHRRLRVSQPQIGIHSPERGEELSI